MVLRIIGCIISWVLYIIGVIISKPMNWFGLGFLYPIYNKVMVSSINIQELFECSGPWRLETLTRTKE